MKNFIRTFFCLLAGFDPKAVALTSVHMQIKYVAIGFMLIFTTCLAFFGGFEISDTFTHALSYRLLIAAGYAIFIFCIDFFFVVYMQGTSAWVMLIRIAISVLLSIFVALPIPLRLSSDKVDFALKQQKASEIATADSLHFAKIESLKQPIDDIEKEMIAAQKAYVREGLSGHLGRYEDKLASYRKDSVRYVLAKHQFDSVAGILNVNHAEQKAVLESKASDDFFSKVECLFRLAVSNPYVGIPFFIVLIVVVMAETSVIIFKKSLDTADDEYKLIQKKIVEAQKPLQDILLNQRIEEDKIIAGINKEQTEYRHKQSKMEAQKKELHNIIVWETFLKEAEKGFKDLGFERSEQFAKQMMQTMAERNADRNAATDILYCTVAMKETLNAIKLKSDNNNLLYNIFNWTLENITYDEAHSKQFYRTARECYNNKAAVCGEATVLIMAFCKEAGIETFFCEVMKDDSGKPVQHACVAVPRANGYQLVDFAYKAFDIPHKEFRILSMEELNQKYTNWNH